MQQKQQNAMTRSRHRKTRKLTQTQGTEQKEVKEVTYNDPSASTLFKKGTIHHVQYPSGYYF